MGISSSSRRRPYSKTRTGGRNASVFQTECEPRSMCVVERASRQLLSVCRLGYVLDDRGSILGRGSDGKLPLRHCLQTESYPLPQPPVRLLPRALTSGVKRPGRETDHSSPSSASTPQYFFTNLVLN